MAYNFHNGFPRGYDGRSYGCYMPTQMPRSYHRQPPSPEDGSSDSNTGGDFTNTGPEIKVDVDDEAELALLNARPYALSGQHSTSFSGPPAGSYGRGGPGSHAYGPSGSLSLPSDIAGGRSMHPQGPMFGGYEASHPIDYTASSLQMGSLSTALMMDVHNPVMHSPSPSESDVSWDSDYSPSPPGSVSPAPQVVLPPHEETEAYLRRTLEIAFPYPLNLSSLPNEPFGKDNRQPPISTLIKLAIWGSKAKRLTLRQIFEEIEKRYPSWKKSADKPWQRSIRHNLSLKAIFIRIERPVSHPGKGNYWALDHRQGEGNKRDRKRRDPSGRTSTRMGGEDDDDDVASDGEEDESITLSSGRGSAAHQALRLPDEGVQQYAQAQGRASPYQQLPPHPPHGVSLLTPNHSIRPNIAGPNMRWDQRSPHPSRPMSRPPSGMPPMPPHIQQQMQMQSHAQMQMMMGRCATTGPRYPPVSGGFVPPPNIEPHLLRRNVTEPIVGRHQYSYPHPQAQAQMPLRQMMPPPHPQSQAHMMPNVMQAQGSRRPHSHTVPEEDDEERARGARRHRAQ